VIRNEKKDHRIHWINVAVDTNTLEKNYFDLAQVTIMFSIDSMYYTGVP